jgi:hypothetical protein
VIILPGGTLVLRTDTIEPVISSAEVAARIPNDGNIEVFQRAENVLAEAVLVGEWITGVIDAAIDASAHVPIENGLVPCSILRRVLNRAKVKQAGSSTGIASAMAKRHDSLSKAGIDIGIDLRNATGRVDGDDRGLMVLELSERSHDDSLALSQDC